MCHKKCCEEAENVLCSSRDGSHYKGNQKIGDQRVFYYKSNDTTFDPPSVPLDSTFKTGRDVGGVVVVGLF